MHVTFGCRAAVIDEIELASQMDSNVFNTGAGKEKQYLPPHLHTLKATETAQLETILETDKQQDLKDRIEQLEQTIASGIEKLSVVSSRDPPALRSQHGCLHAHVMSFQ